MSTIYRRQGIFQYSYFEDGRRKFKSLKCRDRKIAEILKARLDLDNEKVSARLPIGVKVKDFLAEYDSAHLTRLKPRTRKDIMIILNRFIRQTEVETLADITPGVITKWINRTTRVKSPSAKTWNNQRGYIKSFLSKAVPRYLRVNPADTIHTMKVPKNQIQFFTDEEYQKLEDAAAGSIKDMVVIARYAGLRIGEIIHLEGEDIVFGQRPMIYVKNKPKWGFTVKNYQSRGIPLSREAVAKLGHLKGKTGVLFGIDGKPYLRFKETEINRAMTAAGVKEKGLAWHKLRHTFASRLAQNGVPLQQIMVWMGHGDYKTVLRYAHMAPGYSSEIEKINLVTADKSADI
jgi:integrase